MIVAMHGMIQSQRLRSFALALVAATVTLLSPLLPIRAAAQTAYVCQGEAAEIVYIGYEHVIVGTDGPDVIYVEGGWNTVDGLAGDDKICVVGHFNTLAGGNGDDELIGEGLYNELHGEEGDDVLVTDAETGLMPPGAGTDRCNGDPC